MTLRTPEARQRVAFAALLFALFLIGEQRAQASGGPTLLFFLAPAIAIIATGHVRFEEIALRTLIAVALFILAAQLVQVSMGRGMLLSTPVMRLLTATIGLGALYFVVIAMTSSAVRWLWPASDRWTK
ncbi:MAG: hypothetical protein AAF762_03600 [Pseudomonadota bacterium]